jgi:hypothetical protein
MGPYIKEVGGACNIIVEKNIIPHMPFWVIEKFQSPLSNGDQFFSITKKGGVSMTRSLLWRLKIFDFFFLWDD